MLIYFVIAVSTVLCIFGVLKMANSIRKDPSFRPTRVKKILFAVIVLASLLIIFYTAVSAFTGSAPLSLLVIVVQISIVIVSNVGILFVYYTTLEREYFWLSWGNDDRGHDYYCTNYLVLNSGYMGRLAPLMIM